MDGEVTGFFVGTFLGFTLGVLAYSAVQDAKSNSPTNQIKSAIEVCEQTLPRTQHCEITAIPKGK